jgi:hypothetical protein
MGNLRHRLLGLCLPPACFALLDGTLTLAGQSAAYWAGTHAEVNEASPTFHHLLAMGPLAFAAGMLVWIGVFVGIILLVPDTLALILCIAVTFGHTAGAATWILWRFQYSYQVCNGLFLCAAVALGLGIRLGWHAEPPAAERPAVLSAPWRWGIIAALFAIGVYVALWPRMP